VLALLHSGQGGLDLGDGLFGILQQSQGESLQPWTVKLSESCRSAEAIAGFAVQLRAVSLESLQQTSQSSPVIVLLGCGHGPLSAALSELRRPSHGPDGRARPRVPGAFPRSA